MLSKQYRLPSRVRLSQSRFYKTSSWSVKIAPNDIDHSRYGFLVRKTVDKRSVVRNRIRRVFRACIEELQTNISPGNDMLFFLEKSIMTKHQQELRIEIQSFLAEKKLMV